MSKKGRNTKNTPYKNENCPGLSSEFLLSETFSTGKWVLQVVGYNQRL